MRSQDRDALARLAAACRVTGNDFDRAKQRVADDSRPVSMAADAEARRMFEAQRATSGSRSGRGARHVAPS